MYTPQGIHPHFVAAMDVFAIGGVLGSFIGILPPVGALLGITWYGVLFYDRFIGRDRSQGPADEPKSPESDSNSG
jgi:hypothetical protein